MDERKLPPMPKFASEAEEAQWWFDHREELGQDLVTAMERGTTGESSANKRARKMQETLTKSSAA